MSVQRFQSLRLVLLARTAQAFQTVSDIDLCTAQLVGALPHHERAELCIVVDMRLAPIRVAPFLDPAFERFRRETESGFLKGAVIATTALGRIRAERLSTRIDAPPPVVGSMDEALHCLFGEPDLNPQTKQRR